MKPLPHPRRTLLSVAVLLALWGCGPGTGGTGTGETNYLALFGATPASVCDSAQANNFSCTRVGSPAQPANNISEGTQMVNYADVAQGGNISVAIAVNSIVLDARCQGLHFLGDWGITAANDARFFGSYTQGASGARVPATLSVQTLGIGRTGELSVTLREASGRVVLGPVTLQMVSEPVMASMACT